MNAVDNNLSATAGDLYNSKLHAQLWAAINDEINLPECDIYRCVKSNDVIIMDLERFIFFVCVVTTRIWRQILSAKMARCGPITIFSIIGN